jgi:hypothetical protein
MLFKILKLFGLDVPAKVAAAKSDGRWLRRCPRSPAGDWLGYPRDWNLTKLSAFCRHAIAALGMAAETSPS